MTNTVHEAIEAAERILPGVAAPEGEIDPRWQAIIELEWFIETDPEEVWRFIQRWGRHEDEDLRTAIATCLPEDLLEEMGQAKEPANAERFDRLQSECRRAAG